MARSAGRPHNTTVHPVGLIFGLLAIGTVLLDAFETIILPRRASGKIRLTRLFYLITWRPWSAVVGRFQNRRMRETGFSFYGPLSLLFLMALWAAGLVFGFGLIFYGLGAPLRDPLGLHPLHTGIYISGTTLFTLGLGDIIPLNHWARDLVIVEAGTGLGFVAVVIGYLPVLYQAFSRREGSIALLDARAGSPPTASELLRRHASDGGNDALVELLAEWERWSAEMLESHISYPLLCYFRSQHDNQSWLSAVTAILDTCAVLLSIVDCSACRQARLTFAMARHTVVDLLLCVRHEACGAGAAGGGTADHRGQRQTATDSRRSQRTGAGNRARREDCGESTAGARTGAADGGAVQGGLPAAAGAGAAGAAEEAALDV